MQWLDSQSMTEDVLHEQNEQAEKGEALQGGEVVCVIAWGTTHEVSSGTQLIKNSHNKENPLFSAILNSCVM